MRPRAKAHVRMSGVLTGDIGAEHREAKGSEPSEKFVGRVSPLKRLFLKCKFVASVQYCIISEFEKNCKYIGGYLKKLDKIF